MNVETLRRKREVEGPNELGNKSLHLDDSVETRMKLRRVREWLGRIVLTRISILCMHGVQQLPCHPVTVS